MPTAPRGCSPRVRRRRGPADGSALAYDSGLTNSPSDFNTLFKRTYGVTPSQARAGVWSRP